MMARAWLQPWLAGPAGGGVSACGALHAPVCKGTLSRMLAAVWSLLALQQRALEAAGLLFVADMSAPDCTPGMAEAWIFCLEA